MYMHNCQWVDKHIGEVIDYILHNFESTEVARLMYENDNEVSNNIADKIIALNVLENIEEGELKCQQ